MKIKDCTTVIKSCNDFKIKRIPETNMFREFFLSLNQKMNKP